MISVCMATYNGEKYIIEQINSILSQLDECDELIISDDGSTDRTIEIIQQINDKRIRMIYNHNSIHGYTSNFYNALKMAEGDFIFLSDQDDVWMPGKVQKTMEKLQKFSFTISDAIEVDKELNSICDSRVKKYRIKRGFVSNLLRSRYIGCCMAFDRNVLDMLFPVPTYTNKYPHDLWIALIGEFYFPSTLIQEPLILYRRHGENCSDGGKGSNKGGVDFISKIIIRFYYLFYVFRQKFIKKGGKE